jgi:branched-chain amino acid transport system substrate-binding protein
MRRAALFLALLAAAVPALVACSGSGKSSSGTAAAPVPRSMCSQIAYGGGGRPRFLIPLVAPFQGAYSDHGVQNAQAVKLVLQQRGWRAGDHAVGTQLCDEASAEEPVDLTKCERNARAFAGNPGVVAVVGPTTSACAAVMIPILNGARGGPIALIGPGNTYLGLTRAGPGVADGDPARLYPTGTRNYVRLAPPDDAQAAALVLSAREAGVRRPFIVHDSGLFGKGLAGAYAEVATRLDMVAAGTAQWSDDATSYRSLARRIAAGGADGVLIAGEVTHNGARLIRDLRDGLGAGVPLLAPDGFNQPGTLVEGAGQRADGLTISIASGPVRTLSPAGQRWAAEFERRTGTRPCCFATHTAQAVQLALDAVAGSDGSRAQVLAGLRRASVRDGLLGDFRFDRFGDTTQSRIAIYRIAAGRLRYLRSIDVPQGLLTRR